MYSLFLLGLISFISSLLLTPFIRNLFRRFGIVDQPGEARKLHSHPIPRVGGIAIVLAYVLSFSILLLSGFAGRHIVSGALPFIFRVAPAAALIFLIGLVDDLVGLRPWQKFLGQIAAAFLAYWAGVHINSIASHSIAIWLDFPLTMLWLIGCTNAVNLIDGVDGLATGIGLFATVTTLIAALLQNNVALAFATIPLAGCLLGFLRYNFNPATIFLGDSGSLFVGFLLGCYGILWSQKSATILGMTAPLMSFAIPLLDTTLAIARRFLRQQPIFTADRGHIHHRLLDRGLTPRRVALLLYGVCGFSAVLSLCMARQDMAGFVIVLFCAGTWIGIQHLGYVEFGVAGRMFVDGAFRRLLTHQIALRGLQDKLATAQSPDDCWETIRENYEEFGFLEVQLNLAGRHYSERVDDMDRADCWSMSVPLSDSDYVKLTRQFGPGRQHTVVGPFADVLKTTLQPKLFGFELDRLSVKFETAGGNKYARAAAASQ